ncbi:diacylglycerol kinase [Pararhizobium haloflavum]|uniref:diacylglycerol kinase n=1 Tax=Pararhizobium haloflavum TaxID=2037914 RepID=UPI000C18A31A|nr:diacylglycerol kinase [Pararhizobium haloflavum]
MQRIYHAFRHSCAGIYYAAGHEASFKQELILFAIAVPLAALISDSLVMFLVLIGVVVFMMIVELLNTAVEAVCNGLSRNYMEEIKIAKDCGSAAVLFSVMLSGSVWLAALYLRFFN